MLCRYQEHLGLLGITYSWLALLLLVLWCLDSTEATHHLLTQAHFMNPWVLCFTEFLVFCTIFFAYANMGN